jgi:hypothetical protein
VHQKYDDQMIQKAYDFYQKTIKSDGLYVCLSYESFLKLSRNHQINLHFNNHQVDGLLLYSMVGDCCYIAYVLGSVEIQKDLLLKLEIELLDLDIQSIWWSFNNPIKVPFYVKNDHIHLNAQGVLWDSPLAHVLTALGYKNYAIQDTYHIDITTFNAQNYIEQQTQKLLEMGVEFRTIRGGSVGIDDFLNRLRNPSFIASIQQGIQQNEPILYVLKNGTIMGFTGPIGVDKDGRGTFGGIELLDDLKGLGAGKLLFFKLIQNFQDLGAIYTTLFTGRDNPAQHIYMAAGATRACAFTMMKKELYR